ncbi:DUF1152 domain-containing protein [Nocardia sp. NPDC058640]|uniref:DUF1152 domain-containing protein n=1 Tax=Nocardia sp. NPDC058640 TaxID=3346571 RepID=UPI003655C5F2
MPDRHIAAIMSYSWDRLIIDPTPGPRSASDFDGLVDRGGVYEVTPTAGLRTGGQSTLPRLTRHLDLPVLLMDIDAGVCGLADQIRNAAAAFDAAEVVVVDVGGDIVAAGHEPGLRSPLADSAALAAAVMSGLSTHVLVAGVGLDGELSASEVDARLESLGGHQLAILTPADVAEFKPIWSWHPSEANGLLAAAADGWRGTVETQRHTVVHLTGSATHVHKLDAENLAASTLAALLRSTTSLEQIEQLLRDQRGYSDVDIERNRLVKRPAPRVPTAEVIDEIDRYTTDAAARGVDALTIRRVIELVGATDTHSAGSLRQLLTSQRPNNFLPPMYLV